MRDRISNPTQNLYQNKCPFFIDDIDDLLMGGCDKTDIWLGLGQSGVGKSKLLKWVGVNNARIGNRVLHIQAEGSKKECLDLYDATWSGQTLYEVESGYIKDNLLGKLAKVSNDILNNNGEIYIYSSEQFDSISMRDIRNLVIEVEKLYGKIDLLLIDYLDLIDPGDKKEICSIRGETKKNSLCREI